MEIIKFIESHWSDILLIVSIITIIIRSVFTNRLEYLKSDIFSLVTDAENIYGAETGQLKMAYVVKKIYSKMPLVLKTFLTEKKLEKIIENVLIKAKESWKV
ncbi:MAG: hypothetical protein E7536_08520 [Ruminococcaceae bacterium]|nr:hypothetical protein [Oscillospiraceae bacterium]